MLPIDCNKWNTNEPFTPTKFSLVFPIFPRPVTPSRMHFPFFSLTPTSSKPTWRSSKLTIHTHHEPTMQVSSSKWPFASHWNGEVKFFTNQWRVPNIFSYPICPSPSSRHMHRGHFQVHPPKAIVRQRGVGHQAVHQIHRAFLTCGWLRVPYVPWWVPGRAGSDLKKNAGGSWAKWWVFTCSNGDLSIYQQRLSNIEACGDLNN